MGNWNKRDWDVEQLKIWILQGKTHQWISDQWKCANQTVSKLCKKYRLKCHRVGPRDGKGHKNWKGGVLVDKTGYNLVYCSDHPYARKPRRKYVLEHRLVMEKHLGRYLLPAEVVHHINGVKTDNRIENLQLFDKNSDHLRHELTGKVPKWSEAGKARFLLAHQKWCESRRELKQRETLKP